jgi:alcohol dehydrogenase (cytochrome c)
MHPGASAITMLTNTVKNTCAAVLITLTFAIVAGRAVADSGHVTDRQLQQGTRDTSGWYHYGGNYENWRFSPLARINRTNVAKLAPAWIFQTGVPGQMANSPIVADGRLYVTSAYNHVWALDARTGDPLWHYQYDLPADVRLCCGPANRGVAIHGKHVFMATLDAHLVALDRDSGKVVWETEIDDYAKGFSATGAPLVVGDLVITGVAGGEYGARGYVDAYALATGERRWRRYVVPVAGEPGNDTWGGDSWKTGGGPTWATGSYDPKLNLLLWPTGNPAPDWDGDARPGDNLYTNSVLALNPQSGELVWYFQFTPHDVWDYDATNGLVVADLELGGEPRRVVLQPNRNGYLYMLDATSGQFLRGTQYVDRLNWSKGLTAAGRPIVDKDYLPLPGGNPRFVCPGVAGGHNGSFTYAFDGRTMFVPVIESCVKPETVPMEYTEGEPYWGGGPGATEGEDGSSYGIFVALDAASGRILWRHEDAHPFFGGALATGGDLVFSGNQNGYALAFDAQSGEVLWKFQTGSSIRSQPVTWEADGRQYVAIGSGSGGVVPSFMGTPEVITTGSALVVFALPQ